MSARLHDLDETGRDDHGVLVEPDPIGHLSLEVVAGKRQVTEPSEDECAPEDDPGRGAGASRSRRGHCPYRTSRAPIMSETSDDARRLDEPGEWCLQPSGDTVIDDDPAGRERRVLGTGGNGRCLVGTDQQVARLPLRCGQWSTRCSKRWRAPGRSCRAARRSRPMTARHGGR
jgi:hypothetical protein